MSDFSDAIRSLRQKRAAAMSQVEKYDNAISVLEDLEKEASPSTPSTAPAIATGAHGAGNKTNASESMPKRGQRGSVKTRVVDLLHSNPHMEFSVVDIIRNFELAGDPLQAKNVGNAVRTALFEAAKQAQIFRVAPGVYAASPIPLEAAH